MYEDLKKNGYIVFKNLYISPDIQENEIEGIFVPKYEDVDSVIYGTKNK